MPVEIQHNQDPFALSARTATPTPIERRLEVDYPELAHDRLNPGIAVRTDRLENKQAQEQQEPRVESRSLSETTAGSEAKRDIANIPFATYSVYPTTNIGSVTNPEQVSINIVDPNLSGVIEAGEALQTDAEFSRLINKFSWVTGYPQAHLNAYFAIDNQGLGIATAAAIIKDNNGVPTAAVITDALNDFKNVKVNLPEGVGFGMDLVTDPEGFSYFAPFVEKDGKKIYIGNVTYDSKDGVPIAIYSFDPEGQNFDMCTDCVVELPVEIPPVNQPAEPLTVEATVEPNADRVVLVGHEQRPQTGVALDRSRYNGKPWEGEYAVSYNTPISRDGNYLEVAGESFKRSRLNIYDYLEVRELVESSGRRMGIQLLTAGEIVGILGTRTNPKGEELIDFLQLIKLPDGREFMIVFSTFKDRLTLKYDYELWGVRTGEEATNILTPATVVGISFYEVADPNLVPELVQRNRNNPNLDPKHLEVIVRYFDNILAEDNDLDELKKCIDSGCSPGDSIIFYLGIESGITVFPNFRN